MLIGDQYAMMPREFISLLFARCYRYLCVVCVLLNYLIGAPTSLRAQDPEALKERFVHEAPMRWQEYRTQTERCDGTVDIIQRTKEGGEIFTRWRYLYKHNEECRLSINQYITPKVEGGLSAFNP